MYSRCTGLLGGQQLIRSSILTYSNTHFCFVGFTPGLFFPKKTYKEPVPIGKGAFVDVLVTHVAAPDQIYVQKVVNIMALIMQL